MNKLLQRTVLIGGLLFTTFRAVASPDIDVMSDMEVTEYAIEISSLIQSIQQQQLCRNNNISCLRVEFQRHGYSYDDKESIQKRIVIMVGSLY